MSPGGHLSVSPALGKGVDVAPRFLERPENSSFHLSLPGGFKPSKQRRVRRCRDGSCDPPPDWGLCFTATTAVGHASSRTHSPPRDGTCQSAVSRMTEHEPRGKTPAGLHSLHRSVCPVPPKTGERGAGAGRQRRQRRCSLSCWKPCPSAGTALPLCIAWRLLLATAT